MWLFRKVRKRQAPQPEAAPEAEQVEEPPVIRKGIYLSALIYVEGDQAAPDDFAALSTSTLKKTLAEALKGERDGLSMRLKKIEVRNDVEVEDEAEDSEKFQF